MTTKLEQRALAAYFRAGAADGRIVDQPDLAEEITLGGLRYIRLTNVRGTLAIYRVRVVNGKDVLKGLKRWPKVLDE